VVQYIPEKYYMYLEVHIYTYKGQREREQQERTGILHRVRILHRVNTRTPTVQYKTAQRNSYYPYPYQYSTSTEQKLLVLPDYSTAKERDI
jgi:hypothetical protein